MDIMELFNQVYPQRCAAFDTTAFNSIAKGYLILAMQAQGKSREDISRTVKAFSEALDDTTAEQAEQVYMNF